MGKRDDAGLPVPLVAGSGYEAYRAAVPTDRPTLEQLGDADRERWLRAAAVLVAMPPDLEGRPFREVAGFVWSYSGHQDARRAWQDPAWRLLLEGERVAWEAAVRHMTRLADAGLPEDEDLEDVEQSWRAWAARQRRPFTPVVEQLNER